MINTTPRLLEARPLAEYRVWLRFADGTEGEADLEADLWGEMFMPLRDPREFRRLRVDPELQTIVWPNGADLAPEHLYSLVRDACRQ
jgi:hypothetical protein